MEALSRSTNRVLSYYPTEEWVLEACKIAGAPVDFILTWRKRGWDATKNEFPEDSARFRVEPDQFGYKAVIFPVTEPFDGIHQEMCTVLSAYGAVNEIPVFAIAETDKQRALIEILSKQLKREIKCFDANEAKFSLSGSPSKEIKGNFVKQRWPLARHPAWMRACTMIINLLGKEGKEEPEGRYLDIDSGDGALLEFVRNRYGKLDPTGRCFNEEERSCGRTVIPNLPLQVGLEDEDLFDADYMTCGDVQPGIFEWVAKAINKHCKKRAVVTIQKDEFAPAVGDIFKWFKGWRIIETLTHYVMVLEVSHE